MVDVIKNTEQLQEVKSTLLVESYVNMTKHRSMLCEHLMAADTETSYRTAVRANTITTLQDGPVMNGSASLVWNSDDAGYLPSSISRDESCRSHMTETTDGKSESGDWDILRLAAFQNRLAQQELVPMKGASRPLNQPDIFNNGKVVFGCGTVTRIWAAKVCHVPNQK